MQTVAGRGARWYYCQYEPHRGDLQKQLLDTNIKITKCETSYDYHAYQNLTTFYHAYSKTNIKTILLLTSKAFTSWPLSLNHALELHFNLNFTRHPWHIYKIELAQSTKKAEYTTFATSKYMHLKITTIQSVWTFANKNRVSVRRPTKSYQHGFRRHPNSFGECSEILSNTNPQQQATH